MLSEDVLIFIQIWERVSEDGLWADMVDIPYSGSYISNIERTF